MECQPDSETRDLIGCDADLYPGKVFKSDRDTDGMFFDASTAANATSGKPKSPSGTDTAGYKSSLSFSMRKMMAKLLEGGDMEEDFEVEGLKQHLDSEMDNLINSSFYADSDRKLINLHHQESENVASFNCNFSLNNGSSRDPQDTHSSVAIGIPSSLQSIISKNAPPPLSVPDNDARNFVRRSSAFIFEPSDNDVRNFLRRSSAFNFKSTLNRATTMFVIFYEDLLH